MAAIENSETREFITDVKQGYHPTRRERVSSANHSTDLFWNVLTILVWLGIATMVMAFVSIYENPSTSLNVLRPFKPTLVSAVVIPIDPFDSIATDVPTFTPTVLPTEIPPTPTFTATFEPTPTQTSTPGPSATSTVHTIYPFVLRNEPVAIAGDAIPDHDTCALWVAGQTYDLQGAPMVGITVMLGGSLSGKTLYQLSLTGTSLQFGQAGYEFIIQDQPVNSTGSAWIQLFDQALIPLSGRVHFDTYEDCKQNLILINFRQVR